MARLSLASDTVLSVLHLLSPISAPDLGFLGLHGPGYSPASPVDDVWGFLSHPPRPARVPGGVASPPPSTWALQVTSALGQNLHQDELQFLPP